MHRTQPNALPSSLPADSTRPVVFLAPEFWGERVAEKLGRGDRPGAISWTQLGHQERRAAPDLAIGEEDKAREVEALLRLTTEYTAPATPSPGRPVERRSLLSLAAGFASALGLTAAVGLSGFAVFNIATAPPPKRSAPPLSQLSATLEPPRLRLEAQPLDLVASLSATTRGGLIGLVELETERPGRAAERAREPQPRGRAPRSPAREELDHAEVDAPPTEDEPLEGAMTFRRDQLLPLELSPSQINAGLRRVAPLVRNCALEGARTVPISLRIMGREGRVSAARLRSPLASTAEGECVERALRRARFPRFAADSQRVDGYPLVVR